jgi:hypothetical protein
MRSIVHRTDGIRNIGYRTYRIRTIVHRTYGIRNIGYRTPRIRTVVYRTYRIRNVRYRTDRIRNVGPEYKEYGILLTKHSNHGILPSERTKEE